MPHYQFECHNCQHNFELELKMAELPNASAQHHCPQCGNAGIFQIINFQGAVGVIATNQSQNGCGSCGSTGGSCPWQNS